MKIAEQLLKKSIEFRKEVFENLDLVFEVNATMNGTVKLHFTPVIKIDDGFIITTYDGHYVVTEDGRYHKSDLTNEEVIKLISHIENKFYETRNSAN